MPGQCLRDVALGQRCWLGDGFDLGKLRRRSSTSAVVPGAAPALAKAGVGGYIHTLVYMSIEYMLYGLFSGCVRNIFTYK